MIWEPSQPVAFDTKKKLEHLGKNHVRNQDANIHRKYRISSISLKDGIHLFIQMKLIFC